MKSLISVSSIAALWQTVKARSTSGQKRWDAEMQLGEGSEHHRPLSSAEHSKGGLAYRPLPCFACNTLGCPGSAAVPVLHRAGCGARVALRCIVPCVLCLLVVARQFAYKSVVGGNLSILNPVNVFRNIYILKT